MVANELRAHGLNGWLAPSFDLLRQPLYDRAADTYGESPALVSAMTSASIRAAQARGIIASAKHYLAFTQETGRATQAVFIDERSLRELYLPPVEAAIADGDVDAIMISYNTINETRMAESHHWISEVLYEQLGFKGFTMSDWSVGVTNGVASLNAGLGMEMPQGIHYNSALIQSYVATGLVSQEQVDALALRILRTMFKRGLFDRPDSAPVAIDFDASSQQLRDLASDTLVLLKNDGLLPIANTISSIAVIGRPASEINKGGRAGDWPYGVSVLEGLQSELAGKVELQYHDGADAAAAARLAASSDMAIIVAADSSDGDRVERLCLSLSFPCTTGHGEQDRLIEAVAASQTRSLVILNTASAVLTPWRDKVAGILWAGRPGMEAGNAIADVLLGNTEPGGRLPFTMMERERDSPTHPLLHPERYPGGHYSEGVLNGFRHYDHAELPVAYPFGHGLSYSQYSLQGLAGQHQPDGSYTLSARITNIGERSGKAVVQAYVAYPNIDGVKQPPRWLRAFKAATLAPGESREIALQLPPRAFAYWDQSTGDWQIADGCYILSLGFSSRDLLAHQPLSLGGENCEPTP